MAWSGRTVCVRLTSAQVNEVQAALSNWQLGLIDNRLERRVAVCQRASRAITRAVLDAKASTLTVKVKE